MRKIAIGGLVQVTSTLPFVCAVAPRVTPPGGVVSCKVVAAVVVAIVLPRVSTVVMVKL